MVNLLTSLRIFYLLPTLAAALPLTPGDDLGQWTNERRNEINAREDLIKSAVNELRPRGDSGDWRGFINNANGGSGWWPVNTNGNGWVQGNGVTTGVTTNGIANGQAGGSSSNSDGNANSAGSGVQANGAQANGAQANGAQANGAQANGAQANGAQANGAQANGAQANGNGAQANGGFDNLGTVPVNGANSATSSSSGGGSNQAVSGGSTQSDPLSGNGQAGGSTDGSS